MLPLTHDQELTRQYENLQTCLKDIGLAYADLFLDNGLCDMPPDRLRAYLRPDKTRQHRQTLLKNLTEIMANIKAEQEALAVENKDQRKNELDLILSTDFEYKYYIKRMYAHDFFGRAKLVVKGEPVQFQLMFNKLIPLCLVVDHIDSLMEPAELKLNKLISQSSQDSKYQNVIFVAKEIMQKATTARKQIIESHSLIEGLKQAEKTMEEVYTKENNAILADHRGNPIVNTLLDFMRQFTAYVLCILTAPVRLYDNQGVQTYVDSWFEKRSTDSFKLFSPLKKEITVEHFEKTNNLSLLTF